MKYVKALRFYQDPDYDYLKVESKGYKFIVGKTLAELAKIIQPGVTTKQLDKIAEEYIRDIYLNVYMNNEDAVILTPTKQNNLGTMRLNEVLQKTVVDKNDGFRARSSLILHVGDRVMQIKNDYQIEYEQEDSETGLGRGVYNGELGEVCNIDEEEELVLIKFDDGKIVPYSRPQLENVELAYAMTVHKAQGCEFDTVILVLGRINYLLSNWRILYTAVTRAKKKIVVTHHVPSFELSSPDFMGSPINGAFTVELGNYIAYSDIDYWIYGHSHRNIDGVIGNTKCLSNQLGYTFHGENTDFEPLKYIEI